MFGELLQFRILDTIDVHLFDVADILIMSVLIYYVLLLFKDTRAVQMVLGIFVVGIIWFMAGYFDLRTLAWLIDKLGALGFVALIIVFQPEIRSMLTRMGQFANHFNVGTLFFQSTPLDEIVEKIVAAVYAMQKDKHGALIVLEKSIGLKNFVESGVTINADLSPSLLRALFFPDSALHDGAVIVFGNKIMAAGCQLPMHASASNEQSGLGMRHRAARSMAMETDALIVVVSEETGIVSVMYRNNMRRRLTQKELSEEIKRHWQEIYKRAQKEVEKEQDERSKDYNLLQMSMQEKDE